MKVKNSSRLRLSHSQHTGHLLPRRTTSYPVLLMLMLCVGVFLASWTRAVTAAVYTKSDTYTVHASVPGPAPTTAATITTPRNNEVFSATPISVSGSCPLATYVVVYRNNVMGGVALCDATGNYHVTSDLFVGLNELKAIDYSFTDAAGPESNKVNVKYLPPSSASTSATPAGGSGQTAASQASSVSPANASTPPSNPLVMHSNFSFQGFYVGEEVVWDIVIEGGAAPYAVSVDWGDGSHTLVSRQASGSYNFKHKYSHKGGYHGSYAPIFTATDSSDGHATLQLLSIISNRPTPAVANDKYGGTTLSGLASLGGGTVGRFIKYIWPSYGVVVLMLISFWLGERREYQYLSPRLRKSRTHLKNAVHL